MRGWECTCSLCTGQRSLSEQLFIKGFPWRLQSAGGVGWGGGATQQSEISVANRHISGAPLERSLRRTDRGQLGVVLAALDR